jgi:hypothetical protein
MRKKLVIIWILCTAFVNFQNVVFSQVQKPNSLQLMPKIPTKPPLPGSIQKKIIVKPAPVLTLNNFIKSYQKPYMNVYISTLTTLSDTQTVTSYDSSKGEIKTRLKNGKELYVLVVPFQNNTTKVRITPGDGVYDIPSETIATMFSGINSELAKH